MRSENDFITRNIDLNALIDTHAVLEIIQRLNRHGYETYLVGGAVRDLLINRTPKDYDVSTAATPEEVREVFSRRRARIIGRRFKIVHIRDGEHIIEVSTFRRIPSKKEIEDQAREQELERELQEQNHDDQQADENPDHAHHHHHHAHHSKDEKASMLIRNDNEYGTSYEDAWRRDFTVNAIFYDPIKKRIIDYTCKGLSDLERKIVRVIGDPATRFSEDPVRMLRALKLVGQYGFTLEDQTQSALVRMQSDIKLASLSRLTLELEKILKKTYAWKILNVFYEYGFLSSFMPNLHSSFQSKEAKLAMELLKSRCEFMLENKIPDSLINAMSAMALPFIALKFSGNPEDAVHLYEHDEKKPMRRVLREVFHPMNFPRWMICEAVDAIFLQNKLFSRERFTKSRRHRSFFSALDLALVVNQCIVKDENFEAFWDKTLYKIFPKKRH